jgi:hypothetical protein
MNELTVVDRAGVNHPYVMTQDQAQALLDSYGTGGMAKTIPAGVNIGNYFARSTGGFFYDDPAISQSTGSPNGLQTYYTVIYGGVPGNITIFANTKGNNLFIGEVFGDVFRGWKTFVQTAEMNAAIAAAIALHESSVNHPYATEIQKGFIEIAATAEAQSKTENTRAMTSLKTQQLLDLYGVGAKSIMIPTGTNLATYFNDKPFGVYHLDNYPGNGYSNYPTDVVGGWGEIICTSHEVTNYKSLSLISDAGNLYTAAVTAGSFSGWRRRIELSDIPIATSSVQGLTRVLDSITSGSTTDAGSANAVRVAYETANSKVPLTRRINGMTLDNDLTIDAHGVGAYTQAEVNALIANLGAVQDLRWSGETQNDKLQFTYYSQGRRTSVPAGGVITNVADYQTSKLWIEDVDGVWYVYLQKKMGGVWYNVGL